MINEALQREYTTEDVVFPSLDTLQDPVEQEFLVFRGPVLKLWVVISKENDPDRKVIVFDPRRQCFGIAINSIGTMPGKGFFMGYCNSFHHALEKTGIVLPGGEW